MDAGKKILLDLFTGSLRFASVRFGSWFRCISADTHGAKHSAGNCGPTS